MSDTTHTWQQSAWAPAHVTGFFEIHDQSKDPYKRGSRGAGLNLDLGVTAHVTIDDTREGRLLHVNGKRTDLPNVERTLARLLGDDYPARVEVNLETELPASQGFGLSGAGALAAGIALANILNFPIKHAMWEAHRSDIILKTGLGDVPAQFVGGAEIRLKPGALPMGVVERFAGLETRKAKFVTCTLGGSLPTKDVLEDAERRVAIDAAGGQALSALVAKKDLATYFEASSTFADAVGLIDDELAEALRVARDFGPATQTMLGRALHGMIGEDDVEKVTETLGAYGTVRIAKISGRGAHPMRA